MSAGPSRSDAARITTDRPGVFRVATFVHVITALFLLTTVLDGPLRYMLAAKNLIPLIYLPKILLLLAIPCLIVGRLRLSRGFVVGGAVIAFSLVWGAANLTNSEQALFGLWVLVPLLYGLQVAGYMLDEPETYRRLFWLLFVIAAVGVLLNPFFNYPWVGASLDIAGTSVAISRQWTTAGIDRYGGFSRASFSAASQVLIFAIWLVATSRSRLHRVTIWMVAGMAIALTTSKGPAAAWVLLTLFFLSGTALRYRKPWRRVWVGVMFILIAIAVVLPVTTLFIRYDPKFNSVSQAFIFSSFGERLTQMWPDSLAMLRSVPEWLIGRGLGSIGVAQMYFDSKYLAADNVFVYLSVTIGPIISAALLFTIFSRISTSFIKARKEIMMFALFLALIAYGLVVNIVEDPLLAILFGITIAASLRSVRKND